MLCEGPGRDPDHPHASIHSVPYAGNMSERTTFIRDFTEKLSFQFCDGSDVK